MYKIGDRVRTIGDKKTGEITNLIDNTAIVKYRGGVKKKISIFDLIPYEDNSIALTPEKFDEAVKALMYGIAKDTGDSADLDGVLEIVAIVSSNLKDRLFNGND